MFNFGLDEYYRFLRLLNHCPNAKFTPKRSMVIKNKQLRKRSKK